VHRPHLTLKKRLCVGKSSSSKKALKKRGNLIVVAGCGCGCCGMMKCHEI